jgi:hypothetical protein
MGIPVKDGFNRSSADRVAALLARLDSVPEGEAIAAFLRMNNVKIDLQDDPLNWAASTLTITHVREGVYYYKDPTIILKKDLLDDNLLQAIVHETGHLNQHLSRVGNPDRILSEAEYILFYRAAEADAQALCTAVTWALKQAGDPGPWEAARRAGYRDVCDAYEKAATEDPAAVQDGRAKRAAFDAWFGDEERLAGYNRATAEGMIPFLAEGRKIFASHGMKDGRLDRSWLEKLDGCGTPSYLFLTEGRDILADPYYVRATGLRPAPPQPIKISPRPPAA